MPGFGLGLGLSFTHGGITDVPVQLGAVAWYDPSDLSTMFQTGTRAAPGTAVAADGDPVGLILDKSGNALDLVQATAGSRPLYKTSGGLRWLQFDGTDDKLAINSATLRLLGSLTLCAAAYKNGGSTYGTLLACQTNAGTVNAYEWRFSNHATVAQPDFVAANGGAVEDDIAGGPGDVGTLATPLVASLRRNIGATVEHSINGSRLTYAHTLVPTADASSIFTMGRRNSDGLDGPLPGRIYGAAVFGSALSNANLALLETYMGSKCGVVL